jgi:hypothetical protein
MTGQTTDQHTGRGTDDVTVDTDQLTAPDQDDSILTRIDEATSAPNGDPVSGSLEAQLRLLLPGNAFVLRRPPRRPAASQFAEFMNAITGGEVQIVDVDGEDDECSFDTVAAVWTTSAGMWSVSAQRCTGQHRLEGYDVKVSNVPGEGKGSEVAARRLDAGEVVDLVRILCKEGLGYS